MATITIKSSVTPEHTQPLDFERFCQHGQAGQHYPLLLKAFAKREPGEVLEVYNRAGGLKLRLVYDAAQDAYADKTHANWSERFGRYLYPVEEYTLRCRGKRYKLCNCTREISTFTRYDRQHLVEQLRPGFACDAEGSYLSTNELQTFDTEAEAMQALEAVRDPVRYSDHGDYFWVEEHFIVEYDVQLTCDDDDDDEVEEFVGTNYCQWPDELSYRGRDYRWSAADHEYIAVPDPDDDDCDDDE